MLLGMPVHLRELPLMDLALSKQTQDSTSALELFDPRRTSRPQMEPNSAQACLAALSDTAGCYCGWSAAQP